MNAAAIGSGLVGAPDGKTALLPLVEQPCPSCTSVVDGREGAAFHLAERINLVVIAKTRPGSAAIFPTRSPGGRRAAG
jgi:Bacterial protein of unknown function (DUF899)